MSYSPASVQSQTPPIQLSWTTASVVMLLAAALAVAAFFVGQSLDDSSQGSGVTTGRTSSESGLLTSLQGSDLGGSFHHRGGNQP